MEGNRSMVEEGKRPPIRTEEDLEAIIHRYRYWAVIDDEVFATIIENGEPNDECTLQLGKLDDLLRMPEEELVKLIEKEIDEAEDEYYGDLPFEDIYQRDRGWPVIS